jgi:organic radical activating enzyme
VHDIPLDEVKKNPSALHNTSFKKQQRKMMLKGERPSECDYCWRIEDLPGEHISDRHVKSNDYWAKDKLEQVAEMPWYRNVLPTYVEVSFSRVCNFKCTYCAPTFSSAWTAEMLQYGHFPTESRHQSLEENQLSAAESAPYVEAFWKWWPKLYPGLRVFRVTGGEPLLSKDTFKVIDEIAAHPEPNKNLELAFNSNLGVPSHLVEKMCHGVSGLLKTEKIKSFRLYVSLDTWGEQAEYIRSGLNLQLFCKNLETVMQLLPEIEITFMCTYNALSVPNFKKFLMQLVEWKKKQKVLLDISYLRHPQLLSVKLLPPSYAKDMRESLEYMKQQKFTDYEINKLQRVIDYFENDSESFYADFFRKDFVAYFEEIDRRRNVSFAKTFPELRSLFEEWRNIKL